MSNDKIIEDDSVLQSEFLKKIAPKLRNVRTFLNSGDPLLSNMAMKSLGYVGGQALPFDLIGERSIDTILPLAKPKSKPKPRAKKGTKKKPGPKKKGTGGSQTQKVNNKSCGGKKMSTTAAVTKKKSIVKKPKKTKSVVPIAVW